MGSRRALALLVTVGVLGVLALLAVAFVTMAQLERRASQQRLHATKALLLARSGLEAALARLSSGQDPSLPSARYGGEDWADDGSDAYDQAQEAYQAGRLNREDCPLRHALRPSFFAADGTGKPLRIRVGEWERGYSGRLTDEHGTQGNTYALKIEDESAKINLNGGFLDARDRDKDGVPDFQDPDVRANPGDPKDTGMGWNFQLARILNVLGSQPEVLGPAFGTLGTLAIQSRPLGEIGRAHV